MFIIVQFPIVDARPFITSATGRLSAPTWPLASPEANQFVRGFGPIEYRYRGGISSFVGEDIFSGAHRAIRFFSGRALAKHFDHLPVAPICAFRRLLYDGLAVARIEVGLHLRWKKGQLFSQLSWPLLLKTFLDIPVRIRSANRRGYRVSTLINSGNYLAGYYLGSTTRGPWWKSFWHRMSLSYLKRLKLATGTFFPTSARPEPWWVLSGAPLLFVAQGACKSFSVPKDCKTVEWSGHSLCYERLFYSQAKSAPNPASITKLGIWHCRPTVQRSPVSPTGVDAEPPGPGASPKPSGEPRQQLSLAGWLAALPDEAGGAYSQDLARDLEVYLLRLHAERECLKQILRHLALKRIEFKRGTKASDDLQLYLRDSVRLFSRKERFGFPQSRLLEAAQQFEDIVNPGDRDTLLAHLRGARRNIRRMVEDYTRPGADHSGVVYITGENTPIGRGTIQTVAGQQPNVIEFGDQRHVFISYVNENRSQVDRLCAALKSSGIDVWLDRDRLLPGQRWKEAIRTAIRNGSCFIACFSKEFAIREKNYMNEELTVAIEELRQRPTERAWFIPLLFNGPSVPDRSIGAGATLRDLHWVDLSSDWEVGIQKILHAIASSTRSEAGIIEGGISPHLPSPGRK